MDIKTLQFQPKQNNNIGFGKKAVIKWFIRQLFTMGSCI